MNVHNRTADGGSPGPTIFAALEEQLGLQLKEAKDTFETIAMERANRVPESN